jgi:hypothetical protein
VLRWKESQLSKRTLSVRCATAAPPAVKVSQTEARTNGLGIRKKAKSEGQQRCFSTCSLLLVGLALSVPFSIGRGSEFLSGILEAAHPPR